MTKKKKHDDPAARLVRASLALSRALEKLPFGAPVTHVYDPLVYARAPYHAYLERYARSRKRILYLGMNPGPFGMSQTGVPFGEVGIVRDWLGVYGHVGKPAHAHPRRPIEGFACTRSEVSGARLWGAFRERYETPARFFRERFVVNYCPLTFMEASGRNRTPDKLPAHEREPLYAACDDHLHAVVAALQPEWVIGIGGFAEARGRAALVGANVHIGRIPHPSPASPAANRGWDRQAEQAMRALGLTL